MHAYEALRHICGRTRQGEPNPHVLILRHRQLLVKTSQLEQKVTGRNDSRCVHKVAGQKGLPCITAGSNWPTAKRITPRPPLGGKFLRGTKDERGLWIYPNRRDLLLQLDGQPFVVGV